MSKEVFKEFTTQRRSYVILNGNVDTIPAMYAGSTFKIPGINDVLEPTGRPDDFPSLTMDGELVPGTRVFTDLYMEQLGERVESFNAANAVKVILGIDNTGRASSKVYERGLTLLPPSIKTRAGLEAAREEAKKRAIKWRIDQAREVVQAVDNRNFKLERQGLPAIPGGPEYRSALMLLKMEAEQEKEISASILGENTAPVASISDTGEEDEIYRFIQSKIDTAAPDKTPDEKAVLAEKILKDPEALKMLDTLRKRRKAFGPKATI